MSLMTPARLRLALLFALVTAVLLAGCSFGGASRRLEGTRWRLQSWQASSLVPGDFEITLHFGKGTIDGHSAVNTYSGSCRLSGGDLLRVGRLASTMMAGEEPAMRAETIYMALLGRTVRFALAESTLTLRDPLGNDLLVFHEQS